MVFGHGFKSRAAVFEALEGPALKRQGRLERHLSVQHRGREQFVLPGYCMVCDRAVDFRVDCQSGGRMEGGDIPVPNWRERLDCPSCHLNNRQRAVAGSVADLLRGGFGSEVYLMEQVTPIHRWFFANFPRLEMSA